MWQVEKGWYSGIGRKCKITVALCLSWMDGPICLIDMRQTNKKTHKPLDLELILQMFIYKHNISDALAWGFRLYPMPFVLFLASHISIFSFGKSILYGRTHLPLCILLSVILLYCTRPSRLLLIPQTLIMCYTGQGSRVEWLIKPPVWKQLSKGAAFVVLGTSIKWLKVRLLLSS